jgi:hypothetical protein
MFMWQRLKRDWEETLLLWERAFFYSLAYLASWTDDALLVAEHENAAHSVERKLAQLRIQP